MRRFTKITGVLIPCLLIAGLMMMGCQKDSLVSGISTKTTASPTFKVFGKVTDKETGQPVPGVRVADNYYGSAPGKACQESWTNEEGKFELLTWYEEHSLVVSAPNYPPKIFTLTTLPMGTEKDKEMNFVIEKKK